MNSTNTLRLATWNYIFFRCFSYLLFFVLLILLLLVSYIFLSYNFQKTCFSFFKLKNKFTFIHIFLLACFLTDSPCLASVRSPFNFLSIRYTYLPLYIHSCVWMFCCSWSGIHFKLKRLSKVDGMKAKTPWGKMPCIKLYFRKITPEFWALYWIPSKY